MLNGAPASAPDADDFADMPTGVGIRVLAKMVSAQQQQIGLIATTLDRLDTRIATTLWIAKGIGLSIPIIGGALWWLAQHVVTK